MSDASQQIVQEPRDRRVRWLLLLLLLLLLLAGCQSFLLLTRETGGRDLGRPMPVPTPTVTVTLAPDESNGQPVEPDTGSEFGEGSGGTSSAESGGSAGGPSGGQTGGSGSGGGAAERLSALAISGRVIDGGLVPGVTRTLRLEVSNPNAQPLRLRTLETRVGQPAGAPGCLAEWVEVGPYAGGVVAPASGSVAVDLPITLVNLPTVNQDACQGAAFPLSFSAAAESLP